MVAESQKEKPTVAWTLHDKVSLPQPWDFLHLCNEMMQNAKERTIQYRKSRFPVSYYSLLAVSPHPSTLIILHSYAVLEGQKRTLQIMEVLCSASCLWSDRNQVSFSCDVFRWFSVRLDWPELWARVEEGWGLRCRMSGGVQYYSTKLI